MTKKMEAVNMWLLKNNPEKKTVAVMLAATGVTRCPPPSNTHTTPTPNKKPRSNLRYKGQINRKGRK